MSTLAHVPPIESHALNSANVNQTFRIQVMQPTKEGGNASRYPVVYATDGNYAFDALKGMAYSLQSSVAGAPQFILVGISYPGESPEAGAVLRVRDFTFPGEPVLATDPPPLEGVLVAPEGSPRFAGAEAFQRFLADELIPFIDREYPTLEGERAYFGHSLGASFGLGTLFTRPSLFDRYILSSPAVSYHGESAVGIYHDNYEYGIEHIRKFTGAGRLVPTTSLYLSIGMEEEFESALAPWRMVSSFYRLVRYLKELDLPGLQLVIDAFPGEKHMSVWPMAFSHGVQSVLSRRDT